MDSKFVVAEDVALDDFERFAECMDLDLDVSQMDADDLAGLAKQKSRIIKAMRIGALVISENGEAVYTPQNPRTKNKDPLTFRERSGASLMAMDGKKKGHDAAKTYAVMADITGVPAGTFASMVGADIKVCEALFALLMD